jgi:hypothetical protein
MMVVGLDFVTQALGVKMTHRVDRGWGLRAFIIDQQWINLVSLSGDALGARAIPVEIR